MSEAGPSCSTSASTGPTASQKRAQRMNKLRELHAKRTEASQLNHKEVVEEYKRNKMPANWEKKREWVEHKVEEEEKRDAASAEGLDYERMKLMDVQADEAERWERKRRAKKNEDPGFSGFEAATQRQYVRCTKQLKPDFETYEELRDKLGEEAFYAGKDTLINGLHKDSKESIERLAEDVHKQIEKKGQVFTKAKI